MARDGFGRDHPLTTAPPKSAQLSILTDGETESCFDAINNMSVAFGWGWASVPVNTVRCVPGASMYFDAPESVWILRPKKRFHPNSLEKLFSKA